MSDCTDRGKQCRESEDTLVVRPGITDPLLVGREGVTDAQIADVLQQGLPHLTDPASLQDSRTGKQTEMTVTTEKDKQTTAQ